MHSFVDAVGHAPLLPSYAAGYWHSKNRYESSSQLLDAARGFRDRGINVSVIVVDFHHWVHMGDFSFDRRNWSDPAGMVAELRRLGVEQVMVSAWPFLAEHSSGLQPVLKNGWAMTKQNTSEAVWWNDNNCAQLPPGINPPFPPWAKPQAANCVLYDPTQPGARAFIWSLMRDGYYNNGIKMFWLDAAEPEISTGDAQAAADAYNSSIGTGQATGMLFPDFHVRTVWEGLRREGEEEVVMLTRSAWAGMSRYGAALWSGDTASHWRSLQNSVGAGLNVQLR
jgi:alpha-D-xyloside xylohydrolase